MVEAEQRKIVEIEPRRVVDGEQRKAVKYQTMMWEPWSMRTRELMRRADLEHLMGLGEVRRGLEVECEKARKRLGQLVMMKRIGERKQQVEDMMEALSAAMKELKERTVDWNRGARRGEI